MKRYPVVLTLPARADIREISRWYKREQPGMEVQFRESVDVTIRSIGTHPEIRQVVFEDIRRAAIDGFPQGVFYRLEPRRAVVIAVKHPSQHPRTWQSRA